jgi:hypothetical protein
VFVLGLLGFLLCVLCFLWWVLCVFVEIGGFWVVNMGQGKKAFSIGKPVMLTPQGVSSSLLLLFMMLTVAFLWK